MPGPNLRLHNYEVFGNPDPFEDHAGPFFRRKLPSGEIFCAFEASPIHCNTDGVVHGGALMTFADYSLFAIGDHLFGSPSVTISFSSEFVSAAYAGNLIESTGEIVRMTGSLIFARGQIFVSEEKGKRIVLNFSGIMKRTRKKAEDK